MTRPSSPPMKNSYKLAWFASMLLFVYAMFYWIKNVANTEGDRDDIAASEQLNNLLDEAVAIYPERLPNRSSPSNTDTEVSNQITAINAPTQTVNTTESAIAEPIVEDTRPLDKPGGYTIVRAGENAGYISQRIYNTARHAQAILDANPNTTATSLKPGQELELPIIEDTSTTSTANTRAPQSERTYEIRSGDTLQGIANQFYNDSQKYNLILNANRDMLQGNPDRIRPGMILTIPEENP